MKVRCLACLLSLAAIAIPGSPIKADSLDFDARISASNQIRELDIPSVDPVRGGIYTQTGSSVSGEFRSLIWTRDAIPVSGVAGVRIETRVHDGGETRLFAVDVGLPFQGNVHGDGTSHLSGIFFGAIGTSAELYDPLLARDQYPQSLLDLVAHPERVHLSAYITNGVNNDLGYSLTIDPAPVPEPTALALLVMGIGGMAFGRRKAMRTRRVS